MAKRAVFDLFCSGKKNELSHYASTAQLLKYGKAIHLNKSTMQNGKPRKSCLLSSYSQLDRRLPTRRVSN